MQCHTELIPPTAVSHAVAIPFLSSHADNLAIAKTSLLQIFDIRHDRLCLVGEYPLAGTVTGLDRIKVHNTKSGGDVLIISFNQAKLSLLEWDPENHRISTISIHYYEGENIVSQPFGPTLTEHDSILTVDPDSRCAALKFGARQLAILPFRQHGDDLVEGEDADMLEPHSETQRDAHGQEQETLYKSSFVLPLTALDPDLTHPADLQFLHEYREPTFGILSSSVQPSTSILDERRDCMSFTVFTLDLEQRASTNLISVPKLPSDLRRVIPLPLPVGGALLIGANELVHVDQSGKTNAIAANEFAKLGSNFSMADQSHLNLKLEGCEVSSLDQKTGDLLLILNDGSLVVLTFKLHGRNVGGLNLHKLPLEKGGLVIEAAASCTAYLKTNKLFVGSEDADSVLISWSKSTQALGRKRSHAQMLGDVNGDDKEEEDDSSDEVDEDDLYAPAPENVRLEAVGAAGAGNDRSHGYEITLLDNLNSIGPINSICVGRKSASERENLEIVATTGRGRGSRLSCLNRRILPRFIRTNDLPYARNAWSLHAQKRQKSGVEPSEPAFDNAFFLYDGSTTQPYRVTAGGSYQAWQDTEFESEGETTNIFTLAGDTRIVQCRESELRTYDADLGLSQIMPQVDEQTDDELQIVHVSACDPYLLVLRNDSSVQIYGVEKNDDIEPIELEDSSIVGRRWMSGCLYQGALTNNEIAAFLLSEDGSLRIYCLPTMEELLLAPNLSFLPPVLSTEAARVRAAGKETLTELIVADLGVDKLTQPFLIVRSATDDLTFYEPFQYRAPGVSHQESWSTYLRFRKTPLTYLPNFDEAMLDNMGRRPAPLKPVRVGRYHSVMISGREQSLVLKEASSLPKVLPLHLSGNQKAVVPVYQDECGHGFGTIDAEGKISEYALPLHVHFETGWSVRRVDLGREIREVSFHEEKGLYVLATCTSKDFWFAEEDNRHHEQDDIALRPTVPQYTIHLLSSGSNNIIHSFDMPYADCVTSMKIMPLEVSEQTHERRSVIVTGSAALRGEDMPAKGAITVFEIQSVVPDPGNPDSGFRLFLLSREETKGAVTAVEGFNGGLVGTGQGLKLMVRGLKEDGSCLPVAFLDAQCQMTVLKSLSNTGLWLAGDCWKGLWFGGFIEEPYKISVLGKSRTHMEVVTADFLPYDGQLYLMVVDADMDLHILQYDPENPKSLSGTRLLHRSTFHLGHFSTSMTLLPSTLAPFTVQEQMVNGDDEDSQQQQQDTLLSHLLITTASGSVSLITPLDEDTYRRLTALQTHLTSVLEHPAGLNPRAYRAVNSEEFGARGVVDGGIIMRFGELGTTRKNDVLGRAGMDAWNFRNDCEIIGGGGLGYL
ncbi:hypothetical protein K431DRAFT_313741 [Polychaeton citri CBS 116435]|uniref:Protein CFT1 n=1 Tax=Polychaeton citri CBS 116435 TaxID=1314669 RepID=A0A9P4Q7U1_9PEZI|nr:hypothetical protein K431DRAFT_313741 [Polychaeton citri CBS 116435]